MEIATAVRWLPNFVVLKSVPHNKYLRYIHEEEKHTFMKFSGDEVVSPYSKLEVQRAKSGTGLVHIRCCYNNRYLVRQKATSHWILAGADKPEEDTSKWSCTLFKTEFDVNGDANNIALKHVQLGHYVRYMPTTNYEGCLYADTANPATQNDCVMSFVDWESLVVIPKYVAFKNDGKYLQGVWAENHQYLQFAATDIGLPTVGNQVFTTPSGAIRIKNDHFTRFWRRGWNWIWASDLTQSDSLDTLFWPVKMGKNVVALRNMGNNMFVKSHTYEGKTNCLNAALPTITDEALFEVHELVLSREIYNVDFRLSDARIYNQVPTIMTSSDAVNNTNQEETHEVTLTYTQTKSSTWSANVSLTVGVSTTFKTGIPIIAEGEIDISVEVSGGYQWGEENSSSWTVETKYTTKVPPHTRTTVTLVATTGTCDVPFSYTQRDTHTNGESVSYEMDDGVYTGINSYNFQYNVKETKL